MSYRSRYYSANICAKICYCKEVSAELIFLKRSLVMIELFGGVCQICHDHHMFLSSMLCTSTHLTHPNLWKVIFNAPSYIHFSCPTRPDSPSPPKSHPAPASLWTYLVGLWTSHVVLIIITKSKAITKKFARNPLCNSYILHRTYITLLPLFAWNLCRFLTWLVSYRGR